MTNLITPSKKDAALSVLFENADRTREAEVTHEHFQEFLTFEELEVVLLQFRRLGLIELYQCEPEDIYVRLLPEADELIQRGGFWGQQELFKESVEILLSELEKAKPLFPEQAEKIASAIGNVSSFLSLLHQVGGISNGS